ncbi:Non-specific serine/threonine protein kinase protein [Dioscorea alata]|uniref:Non-specific serine/threonine protein kinase protein n=1 Tax=Dioscorea alata TaxID=55571 RepID=A0ACB7VFU3_DIOAL|nr:Non-specific serine/threonine protein kinase protein [Dioscorea alata]
MDESILLLYLTLFLFISSTTSTRAYNELVLSKADYQGLQAFKATLIDTRGVLNTWNGTRNNACSGGWIGIKCVRGRVIAIQLPGKQLAGSLSESIRQLTALRKLSLHDNSITGLIPSALGSLARLRGLYLFKNRFSGQIPASLGQCRMLVNLDLSHNSLTGEIPSTLNSTSLYRLNLSNNKLSGTIPVALTLSTSLNFVYLDHNKLSGSIPKSFGNLSMLKEVFLNDNLFSGNMPEELGKLSVLRTLDFSSNSIGGTFPISLCNLSSLVFLNLGRNMIDNAIPESINGLKKLSVLSLKSNRFRGEIPETLGNLSKLSLLDLSENKFIGVIPESFNLLTKLTSFNVSDNNLSGSVPLVLAQKFNASSFRGNIQLCGYTTSAPCPSSPSPSFPVKPGHRRRLSTRDIILIASAAVIGFLLLLCCLLLFCLSRKRRTATAQTTRTSAKTETEAGEDTGGKLVHFDGPLVFTADELLCATAEIIGKNSYGTVYKATLEDGNEVAVKRLRERIVKNTKEFETEVSKLGKVRHPNLVALRAYYLGPKGEKLLALDFMPKGSLSAFLHARGPDRHVDWRTRINIAIGIARGLNYLHNELDMVHGQLTSSNVLLDENFNATISDYGLSNLVNANVSSSAIVTTVSELGYRAPELSKLKKAEPKSDVYSFGVIMLELLTCKPPWGDDKWPRLATMGCFGHE